MPLPKTFSCALHASISVTYMLEIWLISGWRLFCCLQRGVFSVQAWINSLWSPVLLRYGKNPQKPWVFGKNPLPMGKIPKTQGFSQPCTKGIRTLCEVLIMCSSGSGTLTDVQGRKIRVNWGSVCYHTFCQKYNVWSIGIVLTNWLICIPPPPNTTTTSSLSKKWLMLQMYNMTWWSHHATLNWGQNLTWTSQDHDLYVSSLLERDAASESCR